MSLNFAHLSISKKLALAFGVVLLLTLVVMFTGMRSTEKMVTSGDDISRLNQLELSVLDAQVSVERFIASGASTEAANLEQLIAKMEQQLKENLLFMVSPSEQQSLLKVQAILQSYRNSLGELVKAQNRRDAARAKMVSSGNEAMASIDDLQKNGFNTLTRKTQDDELLQRLDRVTALNQSLLNIRYLVRGYVFQQTEESNAVASKALAELMENLNSLVADAPQREQAALSNAHDVLGRYQSGYLLFSQGVAESKAAAKQLTEYGGQMRTASTQLRKEQLIQRAEVVSATTRSLIGTTVVSIILAILAAWVITAQIVSPLRKILKVSAAIASGDLRAALNSHRRDELGQLERSIDDMAQNLRQLVGYIGQRTIQISDAAEELSVTTAEANAGINRQRMETDQVATAMHEMAQTVHGVARDAEEASVAASQADQETKVGDMKVRQSIQGMDALASEISLCETSIRSLQDECKQIGGVLTVIKSLAEQTNLLALNAAIEAARAGQAGTGFAVVADEVRALAQRTQTAATEIDGLVGSLLRGADTATDFMSRSRELAYHTLQLGQEAGTSLNSVSHTISVMQSMNLQIAAAAEQQSVVAEQINNSILEVRSISEQTAQASEDTAASSVALASLGNDLQKQVQRFQI